MTSYENKENLMPSCIYQTNDYIRKNNIKDKEINIIMSDYINTNIRKKVMSKSLKEVIKDEEFLSMLEDLTRKDLKLKVDIKRNNPVKRYELYLQYHNDNIKFFDEYENQIIFDNLEYHSILSMTVIKKFKNQLKKLKLKDYIEQVKNVEAMKYFKHEMTILDISQKQIYLLIGNECKVYKEYELENLYTEEELNEFLEYEILNVNLITEY